MRLFLIFVFKTMFSLKTVGLLNMADDYHGILVDSFLKII